VNADQPFNALRKCRHGYMIFNRFDTVVGRSLELYGEYAESANAVYSQMIKPGSLVLDIGAHIGVHTVYLAQAVGPEGRVLAFEPQRILFQTLCGNLALSNIRNAHCWNMAVGAQAGTITLPPFDCLQPEQIAGAPLGIDADDEELDSVPLITIDSLKLPQCHLINIGTDGMETDILAGARQTIEQFKPIIYIECHRTKAEPQLLSSLAELGYLLHWHETKLFNDENFDENSENVFADQGAQNLLCFDKNAQTQLTGFTQVDLPEAA